MRTRLYTSRAFTVVELLVVIAIIGILVGLLLPAVQAAREASRRTSCQNNLHQLVLGMHSYHNVYNGFPPGSRLDPGANTAWGMFVFVLPFIEQQNLYETIDFAAGLDDPCIYIRDLQLAGKPNPSDVPVKIMMCPSDPNSGYSLESGPNGPTPLSYPCGLLFPTSYMGMAGSDDSNITGTYQGCVDQIFNGNGMFFTNSKTRFSSVIDGTSQTIMFGERVIPFDQGWGWPLAGGSECEHYVSSALGLTEGNYNRSEYFIHVQHLWSQHPGGAHVAFADGSVRFLSYSTDYETYLAMTTCGLREVIRE